MAKETYHGGALQFTFKVDAQNNIDPNFLEKMESVFMELDLNPHSKIYEDGDVVFDTVKVKAALQFMLNYINHLESDKALKAQQIKNGNTQQQLTGRIAKIVLNKNSPATSNLYYLSAYNGDLKPPKGSAS